MKYRLILPPIILYMIATITGSLLGYMESGITGMLLMMLIFSIVAFVIVGIICILNIGENN